MDSSSAETCERTVHIAAYKILELIVRSFPLEELKKPTNKNQLTRENGQ